MSSNIDPSKLKVVELRAELSSRGLDTKGNKPVLVQRLKEALEKELSQDTNSVDNNEEESDEVENVEEQETPSAETKTDVVNETPEPDPQQIDAKEENSVQKEEHKSEEQIEEANSEQKTKCEQVTENKKEEVSEQNNGELTTKKEETHKLELISEDAADDSKASETQLEDAQIKDDDVEKQIAVVPEETKDDTTESMLVDENNACTEANDVPTEANDALIEGNVSTEEKNVSTEGKNVFTEGNKVSVDGNNVSTEENAVSVEENVESIEGSNVSVEGKNVVKEENNVSIEENDDMMEDNASRGEKRKRTPSPVMVQNKRSKSPIKEDEPDIDNDKVQLSWYDSDLHLQVDKETFLSAKPYHDGAFGYVWAGVRATHGVKFGKVRFEVKITEELKWEDIIKQSEKKRLNSEHEKDEKKVKIENDQEHEAPEEVSKDNDASSEKDEMEIKADEPNDETIKKEAIKTESVDETQGTEEESMQEEIKVETSTNEIIPHLIRIGWSLSSTDLQLGESEHSLGYESSGKFVNNRKFADYGKPFKLGDVVGAFIEINDESVSVIYAVNGEVQENALTFSKTDLPDENCAFFPHILSKNYSFELNLGDRDVAWHQKVEDFEDYIFLNKVEDKIAGPLRPSSRSECEVIMMCGLPGSGKTHWVQDYLKENPDKKYTVLGNSFLLNKMTVNGFPVYENYKDCWTEMLEKLTKSLSKLLEIASQRRRNYILDQTNVYPSIQRRKMRSFEGFKRRAVVLVVSDEEQSKRLEKQEEDQKDCSDKLLDMKACMTLPCTGEFLDEVIYAELGEEESKTLVQKYNSQGKDAGYGPGNQNPIKSRNESRSRWQNKRDTRGGKYRDQRHNRNNRYDRNSSHNHHGYWSGRSGGSSWSGGHNDRRENRISRDYRNNRSSSSRYQDRSRHEPRKSSYNSSTSSSSSGRRSSYSSSRNQTSAWQNPSASSWSSNQSSWSGQNQSSWQNWNQSQGNWNNQNQFKQYNQQGYNQQPQQSQGYGYANWNYYGQYAQNWNSQGQQHSNSSSQNQSGQYNQMTPQQQQAWAQYTQQYNTQNSQQPVQK